MQSPAGAIVTFRPGESLDDGRIGMQVRRHRARDERSTAAQRHGQQQLIRQVFIHGRARREIYARALRGTLGHGLGATRPSRQIR